MAQFSQPARSLSAPSPQASLPQDDSDALHMARFTQFVSAFLAFLVVLALLTCGVLLVATPSWPVTLYANLATIVVGTALLWLARHGRARAAGIAALIFISSMIALDSFNPNRTFGLGTPIVPLLIVFAGLTYGRKGVVITAVGTCAWLLIVAGIKLMYLQLSIPLTRQQIIDSSFYLTYVALAAGTVFFVDKRLSQTQAKFTLLERRQQAFSEALREVNHAANELLQCGSLDELWQSTIEIAQTRLGIERCSIYALAPQQRLHGTYGIQLDGQIVPIQHDQLDADLISQRLNLAAFVSSDSGPSWRMDENQTLLNPPTMLGRPPQPIGKGWVAMTAIRGNTGAAIAVMFNDNAIKHAEFDAVKQDLLAVYCSLLGNIAERRRTHDDALRAAALRERNRLARELHDSVSQSLYGIMMGTQTALSSIRDLDKTKLALEYVLKQSEAGLTEMRALIFELRPEQLEQDGLMLALKRQITALCSRHDFQLHLDIDPQEPNLPFDYKEVVYRVGIEAVRNAVKHAHPTDLTVRLSNAPHEVRLEVYDNGQGFDTQVIYSGHLGLQGMRERAAQIGADLDVDSAPNKGTLVRLVLPIREGKTQSIENDK